jgi:hypothetical protein
MAEEQPILNILHSWSQQSLVFRDTTDEADMALHTEAVNDIQKVQDFSRKLVLGRRCYFALCRNKMEADPVTASLIVGVELYEYNNKTLIKPCVAAFKPVVHRLMDESTKVATTMFNSWTGVILRTLNARLDLSSFEAHSDRVEWLRAEMSIEAGMHGFADVGERTKWSLQPQPIADARMTAILDEWAGSSLIYQQDEDMCEVEDLIEEPAEEVTSHEEACGLKHEEEYEDIQRARNYPSKPVAGQRLYFTLGERDSEPNAQSVAAILCVEQVDQMMGFSMIVHSVAFKPALMNDKKVLRDTTHLLVTSLFSLCNTVGAKIDLTALETSEQLAEVREELTCGVAVMQAVGFTKPQRWMQPPKVLTEEGWHLVPMCDGDSFVDTTLKEWTKTSQQLLESSEAPTLHQDALKTLEKVQSFSTSERVYYFLCKDSEVPTAENTQLVLTADMDDATTFTIHMQNLVFKPSLLDEPQLNIEASTKLVGCLIDLMTKSGVLLDLSLFEARDVCSRVVHDKLQHFTQ